MSKHTSAPASKINSPSACGTQIHTQADTQSHTQTHTHTNAQVCILNCKNICVNTIAPGPPTPIRHLHMTRMYNLACVHTVTHTNTKHRKTHTHTCVHIQKNKHVKLLLPFSPARNLPAACDTRMHTHMHTYSHTHTHRHTHVLAHTHMCAYRYE